MRLKQQHILQQHSAATIIKTLAPYVTPRRKERIDNVIANRLDGIQLAIEAPSDINNALAAVRSSEALGISKIHFIMPQGEAKAARTITQGAFYWVDILFYESLEDFLNTMQHHNIILAGGTPRGTTTLDQVSVAKPICIMIGNEQRGLSAQAQQACEIQYQIPMYGMSESLNLSVSAAISLYDMTTRKRKILKQDSDLTPEQQIQTRAQFYLNSVDKRIISGLLK